jgi:hypothetical protein
MTAALLAVHALAERRLLEGADMLGASLDLHMIRFPEREGIDRRDRPGAAGTAVAITHRFRRAVSFDFNRAAKAASDIAH